MLMINDKNWWAVLWFIWGPIAQVSITRIVRLKWNEKWEPRACQELNWLTSISVRLLFLSSYSLLKETKLNLNKFIGLVSILKPCLVMVLNVRWRGELRTTVWRLLKMSEIVRRAIQKWNVSVSFGNVVYRTVYNKFGNAVKRTYFTKIKIFSIYFLLSKIDLLHILKVLCHLYKLFDSNLLKYLRFHLNHLQLYPFRSKSDFCRLLTMGLKLILTRIFDWVISYFTELWSF